MHFTNHFHDFRNTLGEKKMDHLVVCTCLTTVCIDFHTNTYLLEIYITANYLTGVSLMFQQDGPDKFTNLANNVWNTEKIKMLNV